MNESSSASTSSLQWNAYETSHRGQIHGFTTNEPPPTLNNSSARNSGPLSIISDPLEDSLSMMDVCDQYQDSSTICSSSQFKICCKDCLASCNIRHRISSKSMFYDRFPKGCAVLVVLLINMLEGFATYRVFTGIREQILGQTSNHLVYSVFVFFQWCAGRLFYPLTGLIADTWLGRYKMIRLGLLLMWLGFAFITISESMAYASAGNETIEKYILPIAAAILLIISSASIEANIIPFGVDQIQQGAPSTEISSYFYYYYFSSRTGLFLGVCIFLAFSDTQKSGSIPIAIHPLFPVVAVTLALILHVLAQNNYFMDRDHSNPIRLIVKVVCYAATVKRGIARYRRAFRYGEDRKSRMELAKEEFDGIFTSEDVEDVKTFFQVFLVIFSLSGILLTYGMTVHMLDEQVSNISAAVLGNEHKFLAEELFRMFYLFILLLTILVMTHLVIPLFPRFQMKLRIGMGVLLSSLSPAVAIIIQFVLVNDESHPLTRLLWLLLPLIFLSFGHVNIFATGLEFIYAQSPNSMKGLLTGIFFLWYGIFEGVGTIYLGIFPIDGNTDQVPSVGVYYVFTTFVGFVVSLPMYAVAACIYRNRVRPTSFDEVEDNAVRRGLYGHVSTLNFPIRGSN